MLSKNCVADKTIECLLEIKKFARGAQVTFSGIIPKFVDSWLRDIDYINQRIYKAGGAAPPRLQFGYVDNLSFFIDPRNNSVDPSFFRIDDIHLSKSGAKHFNNSVKRLVGVR